MRSHETFLGELCNLLTKEGLVSFCTSRQVSARQFDLVLTSFLEQPGLPFADVLPAEDIQAAFEEQGVDFATEDDHIYTPAVTLWAFLSQVLFKGELRSCGAAVSRVIVLMTALGRRPPCDDSGSYCRARAKLPVPVLRRLSCQVADRCEHKIPKKWLWFEHSVKLADGSTSSMPDTEANQAEYPQHTAQQEGLGFPIVRYVVLLSLATAMSRIWRRGRTAAKKPAKRPCCVSCWGGCSRETCCWPTAVMAPIL